MYVVFLPPFARLFFNTFRQIARECPQLADGEDDAWLTFTYPNSAKAPVIGQTSCPLVLRVTTDSNLIYECGFLFLLLRVQKSDESFDHENAADAPCGYSCQMVGLRFRVTQLSYVPWQGKGLSCVSHGLKSVTNCIVFTLGRRGKGRYVNTLPPSIGSTSALVFLGCALFNSRLLFVLVYYGFHSWLFTNARSLLFASSQATVWTASCLSLVLFLFGCGLAYFSAGGLHALCAASFRT